MPRDGEEELVVRESETQHIMEHVVAGHPAGLLAGGCRCLLFACFSDPVLQLSSCICAIFLFCDQCSVVGTKSTHENKPRLGFLQNTVITTIAYMLLSRERA